MLEKCAIRLVVQSPYNSNYAEHEADPLIWDPRKGASIRGLGNDCFRSNISCGCGGVCSCPAGVSGDGEIGFRNVPGRVRVSEGVAQALLVTRVQPVYPPLARQARIQGTVVLRAIISRDGSIENLTLVSGHPMLVPAAIDAVKQWKYQPYLLNGQPVEVDTEVLVNFALSGG